MRTEPLTPGQEKAAIRELTARRRRRDANRHRLRRAEGHANDLREAVNRDERAIEALASLLVHSEWVVPQGTSAPIHNSDYKRNNGGGARVVAHSDTKIKLVDSRNKSYTYDVPDVPVMEI